MTPGLTFQQFHGNEGAPVDLVDFVDRANVGMVQGRSRARLAAKSVKRLRIAGQFVRQKLEGDATTELKIFRFVHHAHTPAHQSCSACGSEKRFAGQVEAESTLPGMLRGIRGGVNLIGRPPVEAETGSITICSEG